MRVKRLVTLAVPIAVAATLASTGVVRADEVVLVNQTVTVPASPVTESMHVSCSSDSPGTETFTVWLNGSSAASVTVPFPSGLEWGMAFGCSTPPVTVGWNGGPYTVLAYIDRPNGPVCAVTVGGGCIAFYPYNPITDSLVVDICQASSCSAESVFSLGGLTGVAVPLPTVNLP